MTENWTGQAVGLLSSLNITVERGEITGLHCIDMEAMRGSSPEPEDLNSPPVLRGEELPETSGETSPTHNR